MGLALIVGGALVVIGIIAFVKADWMWAFTERTNSMRGLASERTDNWELGNRIGALIAIVVGAALVLISVGR